MSPEADAAPEGGTQFPPASFELTLDDLAAVERHITATARRRQVRNLLVASLMMALLAAASFLLGLPVVGIIGSGAAVLLPLMLIPAVSRKERLRRVCQANPFILGERTVRIEEQGLVAATQHVEITYRWHVVGEAVIDARYAYLRLLTAEFLPLPRRAFRDEAAFQTFLTEIRRRARAFQQPAREPR